MLVFVRLPMENKKNVARFCCKLSSQSCHPPQKNQPPKYRILNMYVYIYIFIYIYTLPPITVQCKMGVSPIVVTFQTEIILHGSMIIGERITFLGTHISMKEERRNIIFPAAFQVDKLGPWRGNRKSSLGTRWPLPVVSRLYNNSRQKPIDFRPFIGAPKLTPCVTNKPSAFGRKKTPHRKTPFSAQFHLEAFPPLHRLSHPANEQIIRYWDVHGT